MAHAFESGFFTRVPAWHRLGTVIQDAPTVEDGIRLAGLDWEVEERPLYYPLSRGLQGCIPNRKALVRPTDDMPLGVVGDKYQPLQNLSAFSFFNPFIENGFATLDAAGSLKAGRRVWVLAKVKDARREVVSGDDITGYLLLSNSHDGSQAVRVQFTTIRVVCMNTLSSAHQRGDTQFENCLKVRHTRGLQVALDAIQKAVDLTAQTFTFTVEAYQALAARRIISNNLKEYVREVFAYNGVHHKNGLPQCWDSIEDAFENGPGATLPGVYGTYWGAYNAVTHWIDHVRGKDEGNRLDSAWFGSGASLRNRAFDVALNAVN